MKITTGLILLCIFQSSFARFGDYFYWKNLQKIDCDRKCPARLLICNGIPDCKDGSDEEDCLSCRGTKSFHCKNDRCVLQNDRCDNYDDCGDGSDEENCADWIRPSDVKIDVPAKIPIIEVSNDKIQNFSAMLNILDDNTAFPLELYAFKKQHPDQELDAKTVIYKTMKKVVIYIHGFMTTDLNDGYQMKNAFAEGTDDVDCVIVLDWRKGSYDVEHGWISEHWPRHIAGHYTHVVKDNVPIVRDVLVDFVARFIPDPVKVHFIGFSLGGQISGMAARKLQALGIKKIDRISALDPAGPIFEYELEWFKVDPENTLRATDATFVDVIHASTVLGMVNAAGHLDIKIEEYDCVLPLCLHQKAVQTYIASILHCSQITCPKGKLNINNQCEIDDPSQLSSLGYLADLYTGRGWHTARFYYYILHQHKITSGLCSTFMGMGLKAKERICNVPPTMTSQCRRKPYLAECAETCEGAVKKLTCTAQKMTLGRSNGGQNEILKPTGPVEWYGEKCQQSLSCMGESGERLQYFLAYKLPNGFQYLYFSRSADGLTVKMTPGQYLISDPRSVLGQTLLPLYEQVQPISYIMWNDEVPFGAKSTSIPNGTVHTEDSSSFGHSKGILTGAFLLSHTIPSFPPKPDDSPYKYPSKGKKFAQTAVCITSRLNQMNPKEYEEFLQEFKNLLTMMINFRPQVYASNVHSSWPADIREKFTELIHPSPSNLGAPMTNYHTYGKPSTVMIHSFGRSQLTQYQDSFQILSNLYNVPILAQTWRRSGALASNCKRPLTVENIKKIEINADLDWIQTSDHSKWILSKSAPGSETTASDVLCVGDLNRAKSTIIRGGMFICFKDWNLIDLFRKNVKIAAYEECPRN